MPILRIRPDPRIEGPTVSLQSRLYSSRTTRPRNVGVPTRVGNGVMFPSAEVVLDDMALQPYIHDAFIVLRTAREVHLFTVFFKNHKRLPRNASIGKVFYGDALIMRRGASETRPYVNLRPDDGELVDYVMKRRASRSQIDSGADKVPSNPRFAELRHRRKGVPKKAEFTKRLH
ncbi:hypothetical protein A7U60_g4005 [Sanghuangporus baumii]|uniref:Uncharacterized protein n=1 Tax=Sanghuangporus baumii TaxID=108892 RepID=A0A9Q5NCR6_SANBA|nr:hypothetical protein A7U60_g4005 [Sanghuangporus baumii]